MSGEALASSASDQTIDAAAVEQLAVEIARSRDELDLEFTGEVLTSELSILTDVRARRSSNSLRRE